MADEDDDAHQEDIGEQDGQERELGSDGSGAEGQDVAGRDDDSEISTQQSDAEADEGAPSPRGAAEPAPQSRRGASERYQRLANENRDYRERLDRLERERENERQQWQRQQQSFYEQQERERINLMSPEERTEYRFSQMQRQNTENMRQMQLSSAMQMDKASYDAQAAGNPVYRRMAPEVERVFQEQLRKGQPVERQVILENLLGKQALNGAARAEPARRQARKRVENERVAPAAARSSATTQRKLSTAEERLKDVLI